MKRFSAVWAAFLCLFLVVALPLPVHAGATRFEIQTSGAQGASSNSGGTSVSGIRELLVFFDCTASSGTGETLDMWLQSSNDGGTNWFDLPFERSTPLDADGTETATIANGRDFVNMGADVACVDATAVYTVFGDYVRVKWIIAGTTPSYTFSVKAIGKN